MVDRDEQAANTAMFRAFAQRRDTEQPSRSVVSPLLIVALLAAGAAVGLVVGIFLL